MSNVTPRKHDGDDSYCSAGIRLLGPDLPCPCTRHDLHERKIKFIKVSIGVETTLPAARGKHRCVEQLPMPIRDVRNAKKESLINLSSRATRVTHRVIERETGGASWTRYMKMGVRHGIERFRDMVTALPQEVGQDVGW